MSGRDFSHLVLTPLLSAQFLVTTLFTEKNIREAHDDKRARNHMTRDVNKARRKGMFCLFGSEQNGTNTSRTRKEEEKGRN
jgi:hypothetical protein